MQVILLERLEKLGNIGDEVGVKNGFARNFLLPQGKALLANAANRAKFEAEREAIEKRNEKARKAAAKEGEALDGQVFVLIRQSSDTGQLYGSVTNRDILAVAEENNHSIPRSAVRLNRPIKTTGIFDVEIRLHAEVSVTVQVNVARTAEEAERQASGEDVIQALAEERQAMSDQLAEEIAAESLDDDTDGAKTAEPENKDNT